MRDPVKDGQRMITVALLTSVLAVTPLPEAVITVVGSPILPVAITSVLLGAGLRSTTWPRHRKHGD